MCSSYRLWLVILFTCKTYKTGLTACSHRHCRCFRLKSVKWELLDEHVFATASFIFKEIYFWWVYLDFTIKNGTKLRSIYKDSFCKRTLFIPCVQVIKNINGRCKQIVRSCFLSPMLLGLLTKRANLPPFHFSSFLSLILVNSLETVSDYCTKSHKLTGSRFQPKHQWHWACRVSWKKFSWLGCQFLPPNMQQSQVVVQATLEIHCFKLENSGEKHHLRCQKYVGILLVTQAENRTIFFHSTNLKD